MKPTKFLSMLTIAACLAGCGNKAEQQATVDDTNIIGRHEITAENGRMTPEILWSFGRLGDVQVSPDGKQLLYGVSYYSIPENKGNREIFTANIDGTNPVQITKTAGSEYGARYIKNGEKIAFMCAKSGEMQLWEMNTDGTGRRQISQHEGGINDFLISPDETHVILVANVKYGERVSDKYPDLDKSSGRIVTDLMYKHWDEWTDFIPHPFLYDFNGQELSNGRDIIDAEPYECPMKPFGGVEQLAFSHDGKLLAYTCRKKEGKAYAESTNSDIFLYDVATDRTIQNLSEGMMGYDINPTFSPDGTMIAWESMEHDGYESDKNRLIVMNLATSERTDMTADFDQSVATLVWTPESNGIYFTSVQHGMTQIYLCNIADKSFRQITEGVHDYEQVALAPNGLIGVRHSMSMPNEIYAINIESGEQTQLSHENEHILSKIEMGKVEERWMTTTDGKQMLVWIIYPPKFDASKKYPTLLYCEGGPQSPVSQFWSYRWNFQMMAANDYIIVAPNRRGLYGFGQEWLEAISGDYGGQCMKDYLTAIDTFSEEPFVDKDHLGCVGASFGGFSVYWLAGHHEKRFKAFIAHDGMFNLDQQYLETEEMWFVNWDLGGAYWDKTATTLRTYANSPHLFVDKWDTPILCIHGEKDYRILASQGMAAFNAAKLRGVPAELLIFPDENHWVLQPQNGILWQRTFFEWLDQWLKVEEE